MGGAGMKPNDVSDRAWKFALERRDPYQRRLGLHVVNAATLANEMREAADTARAFDAATADLREACGWAFTRDAMPVSRNKHNANHYDVWFASRATLAAYTPMVAYRDLKGEE